MLERRRYQRYKVRDGVYAILGDEAERVGRITDIGQGGLGFVYKNIQELFFEDTIDQQTCSELLIFFDNLDFIKKLPPRFTVRIINEIALPGGGPFSKRVRCSVEFLNMTSQQKKWLKYFIRRHTLSAVGLREVEDSKS